MSVADCRPTDPNTYEEYQQMSILFITQRNFDALSDALNLNRIILEHPIMYDLGNLNNYISPRLGHKNTPEQIEAHIKFHTGRKRSQETKDRIKTAALKSYENGRKGMSGTSGLKYKLSEESKKSKNEKRKQYAEINGPISGWTFKRSEKTNKKMSETCKGRFRIYREDGSWSWGYPQK